MRAKDFRSTNWVFRAQPVPYAWVPPDTARSERDITELDPVRFRVPG